MISLEELEDIGLKAREKYSILGSIDLDGLNVYGSCVEIASYIEEKSMDDLSVPKDKIEKARCDVIGEEMHYFVFIDCELVNGVECDGRIIVDAAIDQFCDEQKEVGRVSVSFGSYDELPKVDFVFPGEERRNRYENIITGV